MERASFQPGGPPLTLVFALLKSSPLAAGTRLGGFGRGGVFQQNGINTRTNRAGEKVMRYLQGDDRVKDTENCEDCLEVLPHWEFVERNA